MIDLFKHAVMWPLRKGWRFLFHWSAFSGLFITTSNCPCCGQPACPTGAVILGMLAVIPAAVTGLFRRRSSNLSSHHSHDVRATDPVPDHSTGS